jgi:hypothetical protein
LGLDRAVDAHHAAEEIKHFDLFASGILKQ